MRRKSVFLFVVIMALALVHAVNADGFHSAQVAVWYSPRGGCTDAVVQELRGAQRSVLVQAYSFTSAPIAAALRDAHRRGVKVTAVLDKSNATAQYSAATFLVNAGIPTYIDSRHAIAHNKVMVIGGREIITGSFNFTKAADENAENLLVIRDAPELVREYTENFQAHLSHSSPYKQVTATKSSCVDPTNPENIFWTPEESVRLNKESQARNAQAEARHNARLQSLIARKAQQRSVVDSTKPKNIIFTPEVVARLKAETAARNAQWRREHELWLAKKAQAKQCRAENIFTRLFARVKGSRFLHWLKHPFAKSAAVTVTVYTTETGERYHRAGCRYLRQSCIPISKDTAIRRGLTPCLVCRP